MHTRTPKFHAQTYATWTHIYNIVMHIRDFALNNPAFGTATRKQKTLSAAFKRSTNDIFLRFWQKNAFFSKKITFSAKKICHFPFLARHLLVTIAKGYYIIATTNK